MEDNQSVVAKALPGLRSQDGSTGQASTGSSVTLVPEPSGAKVAAATPSPTQAGAIVPRRRFQKGNIIIRGKTPRRYGMYREDVLQWDVQASAPLCFASPGQ